jgi:hypothetical protein
MVILTATLTLFGCATVHYGREQPVIPEERAAFNCPTIALEIAKCDAFTRNVYTEWDDAKGRRFIADMNDFGIGNHMERGDALESASNRRADLVSVSQAKGCPTPPPAPKDD